MTETAAMASITVLTWIRRWWASPWWWRPPGSWMPLWIGFVTYFPYLSEILFVSTSGAVVGAMWRERGDPLRGRSRAPEGAVVAGAERDDAHDGPSLGTQASRREVYAGPHSVPGH